MTRDLPPDLDFQTLRDVAITAAQAASGKVWTDYNLHDPGVTLLEQTVFGLTELAYMGDHAPRDLLTYENGIFRPQELGLFAPETVLLGRPVTAYDQARFLSDLPDIDRVFVRDSPVRGLVDITVIPRTDPTVKEAEAAALMRADTRRTDEIRQRIRAAFDLNRLLGGDIGRITIATARPVSLSAVLVIAEWAIPEEIVAEVIFQVRLVFKGLPAMRLDQTDGMGASRAQVFDDVAKLGPSLAPLDEWVNRTDIVLAALRDIHGLDRITDLALPPPPPPPTDAGQDQAQYDFPVLATDGQTTALRVMRNGTALRVDAAKVEEELDRLEAARITALGNRKQPDDWRVLTPGRHRDTARAPLDSTLPAPYRRAAKAAKKKGRTAAAFTSYRAMMDHQLDAMIAPVATLPDTYRVNALTDLADPAAVRERVAVLDYLIALQGETMPASDPDDLHVYRGPAARLAWQVTWREGYLSRLPAYHHYTGTAHPTFGFASQLAHLADLDWARDGAPDGELDWVAADRASAAGMAQTTETPDTQETPETAPETTATESPPASMQTDPRAVPPPSQKPRDKVHLPTPDTRALISQGARQTARSLAWLRQTAPWITQTTTTPRLLQAAVRTDAYIVTHNDKVHGFDTLFAPDDESDLFICGDPMGRSAARARAKMLQASFVQLSRKAERFWLIEDIRLRPDADSDTNSFTPDRATLILPGWTARTSRLGYRRYVEDLILRLAPAHVYVQPLWVDFATLQDLMPLLDQYHRPAHDASPTAKDALRQALQSLQEGTPA